MGKLKTIVEKQQILPLQVNSGRCGFGHFYQSLAIKDEQIVSAWQEIKTHHEELHRLGQEVMTHIWHKKYEQAKAKYTQAIANRLKFFSRLTKF